MYTLLYEDILNGLIEYNNRLDNYGNEIVRLPPLDPEYPLSVFTEIRNVANPRYNTCFDRVASVGYRLDIYAKDKGNITKDRIAREIAELMDKYLTYIGLTRISFNIMETENDNSLFRIIMTYSGNVSEYRKILI